MALDPYDPTHIRVDMAVSRCRAFKEDGMAEVWGHVGDYEVCVWLPLDDPRVGPLLEAQNAKRPRASNR